MSKELGITKLEDWYNIHWSQFINVGGSSLVKKYGGLVNLLHKFYPNFNWNFSFFQKPNRGSNKTQNILFNFIKELYPNQEVYQEYPINLLLNENDKSLLTFDIYIPSIRTAFEFQGTQHFDQVMNINIY